MNKPGFPGRVLVVGLVTVVLGDAHLAWTLTSGGDVAYPAASILGGLAVVLVGLWLLLREGRQAVE